MSSPGQFWCGKQHREVAQGRTLGKPQKAATVDPILFAFLEERMGPEVQDTSTT
jgi:hypothetical protein